MPANNKSLKGLFAVLALAGLCSAHAQQAPASLPSLPAMPGASAGGLAAPGSVIAGSREAEAQKGLTYRDPSTVLSIGEISEIQAKKANAELYKKYGFTDVVIKKAPDPVALAADAPKPRPKLAVVTMAVWGKPGALQAEAVFNGVMKTVHGGETVAPGVVVAAVTNRGLELQVTAQPPEKVAPRHKAAPAAAATQVDGAAKPVVRRAVVKKTDPAAPTVSQQWAFVGKKIEVPL